MPGQKSPRGQMHYDQSQPALQRGDSMPVRSCSENNRPGYRWGEEGKCYTYKKGDKEGASRARARAERQGAAVEANRR